MIKFLLLATPFSEKIVLLICYRELETQRFVQTARPEARAIVFVVHRSSKTKKVTTRKQRKMKIDTNMTMDAKASIIIFNFNAFEDLNYHRKPNTICQRIILYMSKNVFEH